jgi:hypothetical protein
MSVFSTMNFIDNLRKAINGYHMINNCPIKESVWESILCQVLKKVGINYEYTIGSHTPGQDITIDDDNILSCKTCKETKKDLNISSYRLTKCKTIDDFVHEIDNVRANFTHYIILSRSENKTNITYNLYLIPSERIKAIDHKWETKYKKNKEISLWKTDNKNGVQMSITPSMSNQLWVKLDKSQFVNNKICTIEIKTNNNILDYCSLFDKLSVSVPVPASASA